ncbi:MAG: type II toxin-antitoxin system Phd/YefM family antitoxin [Propionibacteriaceae bacterium]|nr:type II toxin-antitoxin system Phd/YefM family antitoxin [Propionibacteriaceae bacterium]
MPTVGVREFREDLSTYLDSPTPVQVTRNGRVVGVFTPAEPLGPFDPVAFRRATEAVASQLAAAGVDVEDIVNDFDQARHRRHA